MREEVGRSIGLSARKVQVSIVSLMSTFVLKSNIRSGFRYDNIVLYTRYIKLTRYDRYRINGRRRGVPAARATAPCRVPLNMALSLTLPTLCLLARIRWPLSILPFIRILMLRRTFVRAMRTSVISLTLVHIRQNSMTPLANAILLHVCLGQVCLV